ncbi:hypothetical protein D3C73_676520 [compost metagenome]
MVELVGAVVFTPDHGFDIAGTGVYGYKRGLQIAGGVHSFLYSVFGRLLHIGIECCVYIQSPLIQLLAADMQGVGGQAADIVTEIRRSNKGILFSLWLEA